MKPIDDEPVIELVGVSKLYSLERRPAVRLWRELLGQHSLGPVHHALHDVNLRVKRGEVVGIIGRNGAGKSTLLQVVCGVLQATQGTRQVRGRVAALLELGAGFNPELSGRENVRLNGPLLGLSSAQMEQRLPEIIDFAGIGDYIDQPVRSYSTGMFVRLAFSMATSVEPDILIIDEALSVGDDAFARKSFERIMRLKDQGATILFCSHSLFQIEQLCARALWLHEGRVQFDGPSGQAVVEYTAWQARQDAQAGLGARAAQANQPVGANGEAGDATDADPIAPHGPAHMTTAAAAIVDMAFGHDRAGLALRSGHDDLEIHLRLRTDPLMACPTLGLVIYTEDGRTLSSAGSWLDGFALPRDAQGGVALYIRWPQLPLLKGRYTVSAFVLCDRSINLLAAAHHGLAFEVVQDSVQQGIVDLPHQWLGAEPSVDPGEREPPRSRHDHG